MKFFFLELRDSLMLSVLQSTPRNITTLHSHTTSCTINNTLLTTSNSNQLLPLFYSFLLFYISVLVWLLAWNWTGFNMWHHLNPMMANFQLTSKLSFCAVAHDSCKPFGKILFLLCDNHPLFNRTLLGCFGCGHLLLTQH